MDIKDYCEMVSLNLCTGCVGLGEKDWIGKYQCAYYKKIKEKYKNGKAYDYKSAFIMSK